MVPQNPPRHGEGDRAQRGGGGSPTARRPETYTARKLRRQHPIGPCCADFCCSAARLVIEIDGIAHDMGDRPRGDRTRQRFMEENGYKVLRVPAAGGPPPRTGEDCR
ncbi:MAG: endonuclease domain-containing protein [Novosphingobium sp.]|nr:endonuclease domain-containing protein [Novosphingobium sp.]